MNVVGIILSAAAAVATMAGAVAAIPPAWSALGLPDATKKYVVEQIAPVKLAQNQTTVAVERLLKFQIETQLDQAQKDPAAQTSPVVKQKIQELTDQLQTTNKRIELVTQPNQPKGPPL